MGDKKASNRGCIFTSVIAATILSLNLVIAKPIGFPLTAAPIFLLWFLYIFFSPANYENQKLTYVLLLALFVLPIINTAEILSGEASVVGFLRIFSLWGFSVSCVVIALTAKIRIASYFVEKAAQIVLISLTTLLILQVVFVYTINNSGLFSMFDSISYGGVVQLNRFAMWGAVRPIGLYFEPSICALVLITMMTVLLLRDKLFTLTGFIGALGISATTSYFGFIALITLLIINCFGMLHERKKCIHLVHKILLWVILWAGFTYAYSAAQDASLSPFSRSGEAMAAISASVFGTTEVKTSETSSGLRILSPSIVARDVLLNHPTGIVLGKFSRPEFREFEYQLHDGRKINVTINNGFLILIFYFGWYGIAALISIAWLTVRSIIHFNFSLLVLMAYVFLSLNVTGMILSPEYVVLLTLIIYQYRISVMRTSVNECTEKATTESI